MSESVKILIEAEDMATPVVAKSAKAVDGLDASVKRFKETGEKAKKSTEFFKVIANSFGGSEAGKYAQQLGELTEKTSQFAEVQKLGGAGAIAFKLGLVAAVGAIAFGFGNAIGNVIFQTEKWTKKLAEAAEEAKRLAAETLKLNALQFSDSKSEIETIKDPEQKRVAYEKLLNDLRKNMAGVEDSVRRSKKEVEEWDKAWKITGNRIAFADRAKAQLAEEKERLQMLKEQSREIDRMPRVTETADLDIARSYVKSLRDEVAVLSVLEREREKVKALQTIPTAGDEQDEALKLVAEKERLRIAELTRNEWKRMHMEAMQLEVGGKERVDALRLQDQGIAKNEAERMAAEQAKIDLRKQEGTKPLLQGKEERLLTRGTVDPVLQVAKEQLQELKSIGDILSEQEGPPLDRNEYTVLS